MADVVIISGSPGSGKTTVAKALARHYERSVHLHTDDFWHNIVVGGVPPYLPEADDQNQTVVAVTAAAAFGYAAGGFTTIVDGIVGPWMLHHYRDRSSDRARDGVDCGLHYVVLRPDRATALRRAQQRTAPDALVEEGPIHALWDQFADLGELEPHALDTTRFDVSDTVTTVRAALRSGACRIDRD